RCRPLIVPWERQAKRKPPAPPCWINRLTWWGKRFRLPEEADFHRSSKSRKRLWRWPANGSDTIDNDMTLANRRRFLLAAGGAAASGLAADTRPNFLFLMADQIRADALAVSGNRFVETPHLDA